MLERIINNTKKKENGTITHVVGNWGCVSVSEAVVHIENGLYAYFTGGSKRAKVIVVNGANGKYLRSTPDATTLNNLEEID